MKEEPTYPPLRGDGAPPPGVLLADHFSKPYGYRTVRPEGTRDYLITFTVNGAGRYRVDGSDKLCQRGDLLLLPPGTPHDYGTPENEVWDFFWCHFLPKPEWGSYLGFEETLPGLRYVHIASEYSIERVSDAFRRMMADQLRHDVWHDRLAHHALEEVLLLCAYETRIGLGAPLDPRIEEALRVLAQSMQEPHSVASLAERVALSPSRFAHLFKEQTGRAVMDALRDLRLRHAARQLEYTTKPIAEVAADVGYPSPFYFSKQFAGHYGASPSVYRKRAHSIPADHRLHP